MALQARIASLTDEEGAILLQGFSEELEGFFQQQSEEQLAAFQQQRQQRFQTPSPSRLHAAGDSRGHRIVVRLRRRSRGVQRQRG